MAWKPGPDVAGGDRVGEIRLGQQYLTLAFREDVDGEGGMGFDVLLPCPADPECTGYAWAPADSVSDLRRALSGGMDSDEDIVCTTPLSHRPAPVRDGSSVPRTASEPRRRSADLPRNA